MDVLRFKVEWLDFAARIWSFSLALPMVCSRCLASFVEVVFCFRTVVIVVWQYKSRRVVMTCDVEEVERQSAAEAFLKRKMLCQPRHISNWFG